MSQTVLQTYVSGVRIRRTPAYASDASVVTDEELPRRCTEAFAHVGPGAKRFQPHGLSGDAARRLYRAHATEYEVHVPGRDPVYGVGVDTRREVNP